MTFNDMCRVSEYMSKCLSDNVISSDLCNFLGSVIFRPNNANFLSGIESHRQVILVFFLL